MIPCPFALEPYESDRCFRDSRAMILLPVGQVHNSNDCILITRWEFEEVWWRIGVGMRLLVMCSFARINVFQECSYKMFEEEHSSRISISFERQSTQQNRKSRAAINSFHRKYYCTYFMTWHFFAISFSATIAIQFLVFIFCPWRSAACYIASSSSCVKGF